MNLTYATINVRRDHQVTVWQSVTVLTLRRTSFANTAFLRQGGLVMKIVWRNSKPIDHTSFSIMKTLGAEQPDELRVFYRSSRGLGALGTIFELLVNHDAASRAP